MNTADLMVNLMLILAVSFFVDIHWYAQAAGAFMFFLLLQFNMIVVWLTQPLPRWVYGVKAVPGQEQPNQDAVPVYQP